MFVLLQVVRDPPAAPDTHFSLGTGEVGVTEHRMVLCIEVELGLRHIEWLNTSKPELNYYAKNHVVAAVTCFVAVRKSRKIRKFRK